MNSASSFGGPFVLLPRRLAGEWSQAMGEHAEPNSGLYGEVCQESSLMHLIFFQEAQVLRVAEDPGDLFWVPSDSGGLIIQWVGADSVERLVDFGERVALQNEWQERLEFEVDQADMRIMDSCGLESDDQSKIDAQLSPGRYLVEATYAENEHTMATVFRLTKTDKANKPRLDNPLHVPSRNDLLLLDREYRIASYCRIDFPDQIELLGANLFRIGKLPFESERAEIGDLGAKDVATRSRGFLIGGDALLPYPFLDRIEQPDDAKQTKGE